MDGIELIAFRIISSVGSARSMYLLAIQEAKKGNFEKAKKMIEEGNKVFVEGHHAHAQIIQKEAKNEQCDINLLLVHAEDQLMSAETIRLVAEEFIELYQFVLNLKATS